MHYSFIPNGLAWQEFVARLFVADRDRAGSPVKNFETVSAERLRDYGLDGVAGTRTVKIFQMFFPLWEPGEPRHKRVNNKLSETCRKLQDNAKEISAIIGGEVKLLVLVIPENPDVEMLKHKRKLEGEVPFRINIWGETEITALLNRHVNVVSDLLPFQTGSVDVAKVLEEARSLYLKGDLLKARSYYEKAESHSLLNDDKKARARSKAGLAAVSYEEGKILPAKSYALDAEKIARKEDPEFLPKVLINLAQIEAALGQHGQAERYLRQARSHAGRRGKGDLIPAIESLQGQLALTQGNLKRARRLLDKCFSACQEQGGPLFTTVLELKGGLAKREGNTDSAIKWLNQAIKAAEGSNLITAGKLGIKLAELFFSQKRFDEARQVLEKAEAGFQAANQERDLLLTKLYIAKTLVFSGDHYKAASILAPARDKARETGFHFLAGEANLLLAETTAQAEEWQKALEFAEEAYKDFAWGQGSREQVRALLTMGRIAEKAAITSGVSGMLERAEEFRTQALKHLGEVPGGEVIPEMVVDVCTELGHSKELSGKFEESIAIHKAFPADSLRDEEKRRSALQFIDDGINRCRAKVRIRDLLRKVKDHERPLEWARTEKAKTLQDTHIKVFSTLLEWMDVWPKARSELLDFWGRGNFLRLLLNHQATKKGQLSEAFTLCVEVTTVEQARLACRIFYPIVDCLALIWKGIIEEGLVIVPQQTDYEGPGGWGYAACAGDGLRPEGSDDDLSWCPSMGWARPLPRDIVDFVFVEARPLVERGRLLLIPAALVGCEFRGHGYFEKLLIQELLGANPIMLELGGEQPQINGFPVVVPYFPEIQLADLARVVDDSEEILVETRIACLEWGDEVHKEGGELSEHRKQLINARIKGAMARIKDALRTISGKMPSQSYFTVADEQMSPSAIVAPTPKSAPLQAGLTSSGLYAALHEDALPWYPLWQLQSNIGGHWRIAGPKLPAPRPRDPSVSRAAANRTTAHWIEPPEGGWTTPIGYVGDQFRDKA